MADPLTVLGGIASVAQLLASLNLITRRIIDFCHDVADAPKVLRQIREKLSWLHDVLKELQSCAAEPDDDAVLPLETRRILQGRVEQIEKILVKAQTKCQTVADTGISKRRRRIMWALRDNAALKKMMDELEESDRVLSLVIQLAILRATLTPRSGNSQASGTERAKHNTPGLRRAINLPLSARYIGPESILGSMGFYGGYTTSSSTSYLMIASVLLGFRFPAWFWAKSLEIEFQVKFPTLIRIQNRVPLSSSFMESCSAGDIIRIRHHLEERTGSVHDRALCSGKTPLILAVEGGHVKAVELLLESGADPNMGDDDRILPAFSAMGMNPRRNPIMPQLPPKDGSWMDILRLLVRYDASVHEVVHDRTLTRLNIVCGLNEQTLDFFHLLQEECYTDFDTINPQPWSALLNATRSHGSALACLQFLRNTGVDFSRIGHDGRSLLHYGAEYAHDSNTLRCICSTADPSYINRQDNSGWTPLHYAIVSEWQKSNVVGRPLDKIRCLIELGADPTIKGQQKPLFCQPMRMFEEDFTAIELGGCFSTDLYPEFIGILREGGHEIPEAAQPETFYDATG